MTENKRFTIDKDGRTILDNIDDSYCECVDGYEAKQYCEKLNELAGENQYLKSLKWNQDCINEISISMQQIQLLKKENEQLKQFQDRVFSWIDMYLQRLPTLRDDEFESDNEFADPSLYSGAIQILETMKKELIGDVE